MNQAVEAVNHQSGEQNCPPRKEGVPGAGAQLRGLPHLPGRAFSPSMTNSPSCRGASRLACWKNSCT